MMVGVESVILLLSPSTVGSEGELMDGRKRRGMCMYI